MVGHLAQFAGQTMVCCRRHCPIRPDQTAFDPVTVYVLAVFWHQPPLKMMTDQIFSTMIRRLVRALFALCVLIGAVGFKQDALGQG
jgi:hypothetical protein